MVHARALHLRLVARKRAHSDLLAKLMEARDQALRQLDDVEQVFDGGVDPGGNEKVQALRSQLMEADEKL